MKKISLIFAVLTFCFSNAVFGSTDDSCTNGGGQEYKSFSYLLIDRTDIMDDAAMNSLKKTFATVQSKVEPGQRLIVGVITGKSANTRVVMDAVYPEKTWSSSSVKTKKQVKIFGDCVDAVAKKMIAEKESHEKSSVMETLMFISEVFSREKTRIKNLYIHSDMIQNSDSISFYKMSIDDTGKVIGLIQKERLLPAFNKVSVYVGGAGGNLDGRKARQAEAIWREYFSASGASLKFYGPVMVEGN